MPQENSSFKVWSCVGKSAGLPATMMHVVQCDQHLLDYDLFFIHLFFNQLYYKEDIEPLNHWIIESSQIRAFGSEIICDPYR